VFVVKLHDKLAALHKLVLHTSVIEGGKGSADGVPGLNWSCSPPADRRGRGAGCLA
jgi:hypothetical protein